MYHKRKCFAQPRFLIIFLIEREENEVRDSLWAVQKFDEFFSVERKLEQEWEFYHSKGNIPEKKRTEIISSWERCKSKGLSPLKSQSPVLFHDTSLQQLRENNDFLLKVAIPHLDNIFQVCSDVAWYIVDKEGIMLDARANSKHWRIMETFQVIPGTDCSENASGTCAVGLSLKTGKPIQVFSAEHYFQVFHPYVDSAAPIRDPISNQIIGALQVVTEKNVIRGHDLYLIINQVKQIERAIGPRIMEHNLASLESMFQMIQEPFLIFDRSGIITRHNAAAQYYLNVNTGKPLSLFVELPNNQKEWEELFERGFQSVAYGRNRNEWKVHTQPYQIDDRVFGGIALFQKISFSMSPSSSKNKTRTVYQFQDILTEDSAMQRVIQLAKKAAFSEKPVLITGETGTGKEMLAQSIHSFGSRQTGPFIAINCGAIPKDLAASELFGYEGGAFTGAKSKGSKGKFLSADQGTIFLDEIGDLPLEVQVYLLRVLEERMVVPIGGSHPVPINVRVIAATHKDLKEEVKKGTFREDLYHRLNVIFLSVPPLRERQKDINLLIDYFLTHLHEGTSKPEMDTSVRELLISYPWPGNIRQLKNVIERAMFHSEQNRITIDDLPYDLFESVIEKATRKEITGRNNDKALHNGNLLNRKKKKLTRETMIEALNQTEGNISKAASLVGVSRMTIYRKLQEYQIPLDCNM